MINHNIAEGMRKSHPNVLDFQHARLSKSRRVLQSDGIPLSLPQCCDKFH